MSGKFFQLDERIPLKKRSLMRGLTDPVMQVGETIKIIAIMILVLVIFKILWFVCQGYRLLHPISRQEAEREGVNVKREAILCIWGSVGFLGLLAGLLIAWKIDTTQANLAATICLSLFVFLHPTFVYYQREAEEREVKEYDERIYDPSNTYVDSQWK